MNVSLTKKQEEYISSQVESGDFQNASELVRDALRLHQMYRSKMVDELRLEIQKGIESGRGNRSVADIINDKVREKNQ